MPGGSAQGQELTLARRTKNEAITCEGGGTTGTGRGETPVALERSFRGVAIVKVPAVRSVIERNFRDVIAALPRSPYLQQKTTRGRGRAHVNLARGNYPVIL